LCRFRRVQNNIRIEAVRENGGIALLEGIGTVVHVRFHQIEKQFRVGRRSSERSDLALQIDGDAHFVEEVDAEDAVDRGAASFADGAEVNGRQLGVAQVMASEHQSTSSGKKTSRSLVSAVPLHDVI
jgi:hypothetical protein